MRYEDFLIKVYDRGEYVDADQTLHVIQAVLTTLAWRLPADKAAKLAGQLPDQLTTALTTDHSQAADESQGEAFDLSEFLRRVAAAVGATERTAEWDASAVLCTIAEAISDGDLADLLHELPVEFAVLFGKPSPNG
jgi:uncharacterized protein (DUF2267 family)